MRFMAVSFAFVCVDRVLRRAGRADALRLCCVAHARESGCSTGLACPSRPPSPALGGADPARNADAQSANGAPVGRALSLKSKRGILAQGFFKTKPKKQLFKTKTPPASGADVALLPKRAAQSSKKRDAALARRPVPGSPGAGMPYNGRPSLSRARHRPYEGGFFA